MIELRCTQCGSSVAVPPDIGENQLIGRAQRFVLDHEECQEPACTCSFLYGPCRAHE